MSILALYIGTKTGWAIVAGSPLSCGRCKYSGEETFVVHHEESNRMITLRFQDWFRKNEQNFGYIDCICYAQSNGKNRIETVKYKKLLTTLERFADRHRIKLIRSQFFNHLKG